MTACPLPSPEEGRDFAERLGAETFHRRLDADQRLWRKKAGLARGPLAWLGGKVGIARAILKTAGLWTRATREFRNVQVVENTVRLPGLPKDFEGFRILHFSDLHADLDPGLVDVLEPRLKFLEYDQAVFTGDHLDEIGRGEAKARQLCERVAAALQGTCLAVPGNHDLLSGIAPLERAGFRFLLNENVEIRRRESSLWICGVDDPRWARTQDVARSKIGANGISILLAHSPEVWPAAEACGFSFLLAGHTHGGQICLPGGFPLIRNAPVEADLLAGSWRRGRLQGYTSRGTGGSGLPARLFCPPEVTIHTLRTED